MIKYFRKMKCFFVPEFYLGSNKRNFGIMGLYGHRGYLLISWLFGKQINLKKDKVLINKKNK